VTDVVLSDVGQIEFKTQRRVVKLLDKRLDYEYLGNWKDDLNNKNVLEDVLTKNLRERGYDDALIKRALYQLEKANHLGGGRDLYEANREIYEMLRYGVKVTPEAGENKRTVWLIDWKSPKKNHFGVAEEVTVLGQNTKRPDLVLYVNGIALAVIELKRSSVNVTEGIRQTIGNQKSEFIRPFFATVQLVFAGSDTEGLRYAVIDTPEKYWLDWKLPSDVEAGLRAAIEQQSEGLDGLLDRPLAQLCSKERLLEVIHDFMVFDAGVKKTCRPNQYFGVKAAQVRLGEGEGGLLWHTQGSGKSLTMVWLAKWLREHHKARVLLITDRVELDEQIEGVFNGVHEQIYRTSSGVDLIDKLNKTDEWLICSLVHKFRPKGSGEDGGGDADDFIEQIRKSLPADFSAKGKIFVFVDEAHRTQSGKMHAAMKDLLPGATFIGFTGTPLLKTEKATSIETFGTFIHTYKFDEAVRDKVVLDLLYEARDIDQQLTSEKQVDQWFDNKTKGMTDDARAQLKKRWGTMRKLYSSASRTSQIVSDVITDLDTRPRLADGRGNAMLVCSSIYQAATFYDEFCKAGLKHKCAVVTSYDPHAGDIAKEDSGEGASEMQRQYDIYRQMLADFEMTDVEAFETEVKRRFVEEPGQMKLLIVVDKLLTGFDAPPATYLYINKKMQDHGLFQAICRVNRLDGEDKSYGHIVDYRDLFKSLESAISDYTAGALDGYDKEDVEGLLKDRLTEARNNLDEALEVVRALCEPVAPPKNLVDYQHHFCSEDGSAEQLAENEPRRVQLYKQVGALVRRYADLANEMIDAGYTSEQASKIKDEVKHYASVRDEVKLTAGESIDFKQHEPWMRFLLDKYVLASPSRVIGDFEDTGLIELIVEMGETAVDKLPKEVTAQPEAVAEVIVNNVRKLIINEQQTNPAYYGRMSELLDALIERRREEALAYEEYLKKLIELAADVGSGSSDVVYPGWADDAGKKALIDHFASYEPANTAETNEPSEAELTAARESLARAVDETVRKEKTAEWVGNKMRERALRLAVKRVLPDDYDRLDELMSLLGARSDYR
jgi:type I restriction enzyme R subunit